jgi:hypothetical protein
MRDKNVVKVCLLTSKSKFLDLLEHEEVTIANQWLRKVEKMECLIQNIRNKCYIWAYKPESKG